MRLTDLSIRKLRSPTRGQKTYFDDFLKGFGVRVSQGGSKSYVVMYGAKRRLKTIGRHPEMKLSEARIKAKGLQAELAASPIALQQLPTATFVEAREGFLAASAAKNRPRTTYDYSRLLNRHFSFEKPIQQIKRHEVMQVIEALQETPSEQAHALVAIRSLFNWCVKQGLLDNSPVPRISFRQSTRSRVLSTAEIREVLRVSKEHPYPFGTIVRLLLLTGQRRGEIAALRWSWIDFNRNAITLPATAVKNGREHTFPIGRMTQDTLKSLPGYLELQEVGELPQEYLFPSRSSKGTVFNGWGKCKIEFDEYLNGVGPYTLHDLRRTFASSLAGLGAPIHVTEKLLNHVSGTLNGVAAVYNRHTYFDEMREAIKAYDEFLWSLN